MVSDQPWKVTGCPYGMALYTIRDDRRFIIVDEGELCLMWSVAVKDRDGWTSVGHGMVYWKDREGRCYIRSALPTEADRARCRCEAKRAALRAWASRSPLADDEVTSS